MSADAGILVYRPIPCFTGAHHSQPSGEAIRIEACCNFSSDYEFFFDARGALDAPEVVPSGAVRAQDFISSPGRLLIGYVHRPRWDV